MRASAASHWTRIGAVALLFVCWLALPGSALAGGVWKEGSVSSPFTLTLSEGLVVVANNGDPAVRLKYEMSVLYDGSAGQRDVRSIRMVDPGTVLATLGKSGFLARFSTSGQFLGESKIPSAGRPFDAFPLADGMYVVDRGPRDGSDPIRECGIMRLDALGKVTWDYRGDIEPGLGELWDPYTVEPLSSGNLLIADSLGHRVIEVDPSTRLVQWHYGEFGVFGADVGRLNRPHSAQRVPGSDVTLIADSENDRVLEVRGNGGIAWQYGGSAGSGPNRLSQPNSARRLANGDRLICDTGNKRVIVVNEAKSVVEEYGVGVRSPVGALLKPVAAIRAPDGSTIVADSDKYRVVRFRYRTRYEYVATSGAIDPARGKTKWFTKLAVDAVRPPGSAVLAEYSMDGHTWDDVPSSGALPSSARGSAIRYRLRLTAGTYDAAPVVNGVSITWSDTAPSSSKATGGSGSGSSAKKKATKTGGSSSGASTAQTSASTRSSSSRTVGTGSGSAETTTVAAGGDSSAIGGGRSGGAGGSGGDAVTSSTTMSGWLMSEVRDDIGGASGTSGAGGFEAGRSLGGSGIPGIALVFAVYTLGIAWAPGSRTLGRLIATAFAT